MAARSINALMTSAYFEIGRRIVEHEQKGMAKSDYGDKLLDRLSRDLSERLGRGFSRRNVFQMRQFYLTYREKVQTVSAQSGSSQKVQTLSAQLGPFPLSWSHYVELLSVDDPDARDFYQRETLRGGWSVRALDRQISTRFFERTMQSRKRLPAAGSVLTPEQEIKDPLVLEFLNLKDEYSESDLEEALIVHLERFLVELGNDFAFVARQRKLRIGDEWYRVDLVFFHRRLRCLMLIDLKDKFSHDHVGQMNMYLNYAGEQWTNPGENPPVGLILCSRKDEAVARYALGKLANKIVAARYKTILPKERILAQEMSKTRQALLEAPRRKEDQSRAPDSKNARKR